MARYLEFTSSDLVRACARSKDQAAWTEFIRRFQLVIAGAVLRTARQWCEPSRSQLDDLVQDTYLKLFEDESGLLRSFAPQQENSIYGFLRVVAANVVHDHFKTALAAKRGAAQTDSIADRLEINAVHAAPNSFDLVSRRLQLQQIDRILTQLTSGKDQSRNRVIFWLRHRQGLTAREIASIPSIGLTEGGVESVLLRLAIMIRGHLITSIPHRDVKVLKRKNRSKRIGS